MPELPKTTIPPTSSDNTVVPGKISVASFAPWFFWLAIVPLAIVIPHHLHNSWTINEGVIVATPDDLADERFPDVRYVTLRDVRLETIAERAARKDTDHMPNTYRLMPTANNEEPTLGDIYVYCENATLGEPRAKDGDKAAKRDGLAADQAIDQELRDLSQVEEWTGVLRNVPAKFRQAIIQDPNAGAIHVLRLDELPQRSNLPPLVYIGALLIAGAALAAMMSQNWMPNTRFYAYTTAKLASLLGWPLRRYRDAWPMHGACLFAAAAMIVGGGACVASGDANRVISPFEIARWYAAALLWATGVAVVFRIAWIHVVQPQEALGEAISYDEPDDERKVTEPHVLKTLVLLRTVLGGLFMVGIVVMQCLRMMPPWAATITSWLVPIAALGSCGCHWAIQLLVRGFREKEYIAVDEPANAVVKLRQKAQSILDSSGFQKVGAYKIAGSAFNATNEFHLGCNGMVVAEFVSLSGHNAIELMSITKSGFVVVSASIEAPEGKPTIQTSGYSLFQFCGVNQFEPLLRCHLETIANTAEAKNTSVSELLPEDAIHLANYGSRAHQHLKFTLGESPDRVGPATYGRLRFPFGLSDVERQTTQLANLREQGSNEESEILASVTQLSGEIRNASQSSQGRTSPVIPQNSQI